MRSLIIVALLLVGAVLRVSAAEDDAVGERVAAAAHNCLGQEMWHGYGLKNGYLGCAAAVSNVLKKGEVTTAHSAGVVIMRSQLIHGSLQCHEFILKDGDAGRISDQLLSKVSQPGDILVAFMEPPSKPNTGGNAHCGIMGQSTNIFTNDWNDGIWKSVNVHLMFDYYRYVRLLRLSSKPKQPVSTSQKLTNLKADLHSTQKARDD